MSGQAVTAQGAEAPGWFGKLSMLGDFASRRLPQHLVGACDAWLAQGVEASRQQLGERWLDAYLTGPIWRFAWAPGVVDTRWWFGVLMPSVDKVGRYFPFLVATDAAALPCSAMGLQALQAWYAHVSAAALATLQPGATLEALEAALAAAPSFEEPAAGATWVASVLPGRIRHTSHGAASLPAWAQGLACGTAVQVPSSRSFWWPDHAEAPDNSLSVAQGLPPALQFSELLEGRW